jgi:hypothetical protein
VPGGDAEGDVQQRCMSLRGQRPSPSGDLNLDRLGNVLVALDGRLSVDRRRGMDAALCHALDAGRNLTLTTRIGDLDVVQRLPGVPPWPELVAAEQTRLAACRSGVVERERHLSRSRVMGVRWVEERDDDVRVERALTCSARKCRSSTATRRQSSRSGDGGSCMDA